MIALELNGQLVYQGSWNGRLQEMLGLIGNRQPTLPFTTPLGTLRNVEYVRASLDAFQRSGTEAGAVSGNVWKINVAAKDIDLATAKQIARDKIAAKRYEVETGGVIANSKYYSTDRDSQSAIARATGTVSWKAAATVVKDVVQEDESTVKTTFISDPEFVDTDMDALKSAVATHVANAYAKEKELLTAINAADDVTALRQIDLTSGWAEIPSQE
tara:strand:- start:3160 stop:3804 length:645 start_codon:yes stop_codon:yes gene_type:complete